MSTRDKVVKLLGLRESTHHDRSYLNPHTIAAPVSVRSLIISGRRSPLLALKLHCACLNSIIKTCSAWKTASPPWLRYLDSQTLVFAFESFKWILSIWEPLNRKRHLPKACPFYHDTLIKISELLLLQPESCQFGWPAPSWQVLILRFVMALSLWSITNTYELLQCLWSHFI